MISAIVVNFNEGEKLPDCLKSVANFADEIIVVDLGSTDNSKETAKKFKARLISKGVVPYVELIRNSASELASGDWILVLDPDEQITASLADKLKELAEEEKYQAVNIPRKNIFFGKWIKHTNWWPDYHVRFFKKGKVWWSNQIHQYPKVEGKIFNLPPFGDFAIIHQGYSSVWEFIDRQNRYSTIEAENLYQTGMRFSRANFFWKPLREFLVRFIRHLGFLDGFHGFALTFLMMIYQVQVMIKLWENERKVK